MEEKPKLYDDIILNNDENNDNFIPKFKKKVRFVEHDTVYIFQAENDLNRNLIDLNLQENIEVTDEQNEIEIPKTQPSKKSKKRRIKLSHFICCDSH